MNRHWSRWWLLLLLVPIIAGLARLHFDVEMLDLLPANVPAVQGLKIYQQHFTDARELIVTVRATDRETAGRTAKSIAENLARATNLVASVTWQPPWLEHPEQTAELIAYLWLNQPPEKFAQLAARLARNKSGKRARRHARRTGHDAVAQRNRAVELRSVRPDAPAGKCRRHGFRFRFGRRIVRVRRRHVSHSVRQSARSLERLSRMHRLVQRD